MLNTLKLVAVYFPVLASRVWVHPPAVSKSEKITGPVKRVEPVRVKLVVFDITSPVLTSRVRSCHVCTDHGMDSPF